MDSLAGEVMYNPESWHIPVPTYMEIVAIRAFIDTNICSRILTHMSTPLIQSRFMGKMPLLGPTHLLFSIPN
jgi:hypothetical protein